MQSSCIVLTILCMRSFGSIADLFASPHHSTECHPPSLFVVSKDKSEGAHVPIPNFRTEIHDEWSSLSVFIMWSAVIL